MSRPSVVLPVHASDGSDFPSGRAHALTVCNVSKHFGGAQALNDVSLTVEAGEIRAVVGENGAGKSTLMRIIAGLEVSDAGSIQINGQQFDASPSAARASGVALVHQELSLVPTLSVAENICLGDLPRVGGFIKQRSLYAEARAAMERVRGDLNVADPVGQLSLAQRQFVEIAKALRLSPRILVLDEPTAALTPAEVGDLSALVRHLAAQGIGILFVSHRITEIFGLCSTATVLKDGMRVADVKLSDITPDDLVRMMVGRELDLWSRPTRTDTDRVVLRVTDLETPDVSDVSFELHAGEILGIGGLVGAGRTEMLRAVSRLEPLTNGRCEILFGEHLVRVNSYRSAIAHGLAFVPEDRHHEGLALSLNVADNVVAPSVRRASNFGVLLQRTVIRLARKAIQLYDIRPPTPRTRVDRLSGGNQQKIVLGKWLLGPVRVLVLDEPTRGVDVGAKAQVHDLLRTAAAQGVGVLIVSSDLPELIALSHRILVMRDGRISGELVGDDVSEEAVMRLAAP